MDWFWWIVVGLVVVGAMSKASEENKKKADESSRKERAEAARAAIIASGDKDAIRQLHLMEASYLNSPTGNRGALASSSGNALGTAAAVAGGMVVGNAITASIQSAQLEAAFADLQADLEATSVGLADVSSLSDSSFDFDV